MYSFLESIGMIAIVLVIIYGCKKIFEYHNLKKLSFYETDKVYKAADEFVQGADSDNVKAILLSCFDFDKGDADEILSRSLPHRNDKDRGYSEFIKSVNKVLGIDVYCEQHHTR